MNPIQKLAEIFSDFPGIGSRQAKRFVYFLLTRNQSYLDTLAELLTTLRDDIQICSSCQRFFQKDTSRSQLCTICRDKQRDQTTLMIVSRDVDLENIERTRTFSGVYFVLGGSVPLLEKKVTQTIRVAELKKRIAQSSFKEIIIAMNATPDGENTADAIQKLIDPLITAQTKISRLGRGISTGTELEYSDGETIKNALYNRS